MEREKLGHHPSNLFYFETCTLAPPFIIFNVANVPVCSVPMDAQENCLWITKDLEFNEASFILISK